MAEIVNLRAVRKQRAREEDERRAADNRARHGRTKAEKLRDRAEADRLSAHIEGHRRDGKGKAEE